MKKISLSLLMGAFFFSAAQAQLTLTKAANEPIAGDVDMLLAYDSINVIPKTIGTNQNWNFSSMSQNTVNYSSSYTSTSSVPSASLFPGATLVQDYGNNAYAFYKSTPSPSQFEELGEYSPFTTLNYSNSAISSSWPISYGSLFSDTYSGTFSGVFAGSVTGTVITTASGTGNITLPNGQMFSNVLQLKINDRNKTIFSTPFQDTSVATGISYVYFVAGKKFPLFSVSYNLSNDAGNKDTTVSITMNSFFATGINDLNFDAGFAIFPNPAKDHFQVHLDNTGKDICLISIYNAFGQLVKTSDLGRSELIRAPVSISELSAGVYSIKTTLGAKNATRKLIVN